MSATCIPRRPRKSERLDPGSSRKGSRARRRRPPGSGAHAAAPSVRGPAVPGQETRAAELAVLPAVRMNDAHRRHGRCPEYDRPLREPVTWRSYFKPHLETAYQLPPQLDKASDLLRDRLNDAALRRPVPPQDRESACPPEYDQSFVRTSGVAFGAQPCPARRHARPSSPCIQQSA
jgi:hypothetical protein